MVIHVQIKKKLTTGKQDFMQIHNYITIILLPKVSLKWCPKETGVTHVGLKWISSAISNGFILQQQSSGEYKVVACRATNVSRACQMEDKRFITPAVKTHRSVKSVLRIIYRITVTGSIKLKFKISRSEDGNLRVLRWIFKRNNFYVFGPI